MIGKPALNETIFFFEQRFIGDKFKLNIIRLRIKLLVRIMKFIVTVVFHYCYYWSIKKVFEVLQNLLITYLWNDIFYRQLFKHKICTSKHKLLFLPVLMDFGECCTVQRHSRTCRVIIPSFSPKPMYRVKPKSSKNIITYVYLFYFPYCDFLKIIFKSIDLFFLPPEGCIFKQR